MTHEIHITLKNNYGKQTIYPNCESSKTFAKLLEQQTLTPLNIRHIKQLGYVVHVDNLMPTTL